MSLSGVTVDQQHVYSLFVSALPAEYNLEVRELSRKESFDRAEILVLVRSGYELIKRQKIAHRKDMPSSAMMDEVTGVHAAVVRIAAAFEVAVEARAKADGQTPAARSQKMAEKQLWIQLTAKSRIN